MRNTIRRMVSYFTLSPSSRSTRIVNPRISNSNFKRYHHSQNSNFLHIQSSPMSWSCKKCTFVNPPSQISECEICFSSPPHPSSSFATSSSSSSPKWSCKSCTLFNSYKNPTCHLCGTRNTVLSISSFNDINEIDDDSSVGSVFWPLRSCKRKAVDSLEDSDQPLVAKESKKAIDFVDFSEDFDQPLKAKDSKSAVDIFDSYEHFAKPLERVDSGKGVSSLKILSYNVWFREDLELEKRMKAIGDLVLLHSPDFICFQVSSSLHIIFTIFAASTLMIKKRVQCQYTTLIRH